MTLTGRLAALAQAVTAVGSEVAPGPPCPVVTMRQSPVEHLWPHGPDPVVFGAPKPPLQGRETLGGPPMRTCCGTCQVQWAGGGPCWCCGQP